ncbi:MAG: tetratricopeptide repeat protein [Bryobacterales bacterium]
MLKRVVWVLIAVCSAGFFGCKRGPKIDPETAAQLRELRHVGKALYESPGSSEQALEQLKKAHDLVPDSARDRLNYALALLRVARLSRAFAEPVLVSNRPSTLPHTYFNLGVEYKEGRRRAKAIEQFEKMAESTPDEAKVHYNLGQLYKQEDRDADARRSSSLRPARSQPRCSALPAL